MKLFSKQGYDATTVRQIADEVGIRDSAIYAHFSAKQDLLDALIAESGLQLMDRLGFDFDQLSDAVPAEVLPEFFDALVRKWGEPRPRMLLGILTREGLLGVADTLRSVEDRFRPHFSRWVRAGHFRRGLQMDDLLAHLILPLAAIRLLYLNAHSSPSERKRGKELAQRHVRHFLRTTQNR